MQAYMKSAMPFYGVQKPARVALAREVFAAYPLSSFEAWREAGGRHSRTWEARRHGRLHET
jgi:hypothetical protein